jgi:hypothetical protein
MSSIDRNPSFKIIARHEAIRAGLSNTRVKNGADLLVQDSKSVPDSSDFIRVKKMFAVVKDRNGKKPFA